ncbi:MAG: FkbM family methyltransferase [Verrucomicrobiota bacterium]|jgi:FkbM family methyltransferase
MDAAFNKFKGAIKPYLHNTVRKVLRMDPGYEFKPAPSIKQQTIEFEFKGERLSLTCDHTSPIYDTIAEIVDYDCYQLEEVDFSDSAGALVLDIGAHVGTASVVLSRLHKGKMLCFEPLPETGQFLKKNLEANRVAKAVVVPAAVTEQDGFVEFAVDPNSSVASHLAHSMAADPRAFTQLLRVQSVSLRSALAAYPKERIHLIKADCEGGEYGIVNQITPELLPRIRHLTFEVHDLGGKNNVRTLTQRLRGLGFSVRYKKELYNRFGLHHLLASRGGS